MSAPALTAAEPQGAPKRSRSRGTFKPSKEGIEAAERKFVAALAAVRVAITGPDLSEADSEHMRLVKSVKSIERALAVYVAHVILSAPKKYLAPALKTSERRIRSHCAFVEAWREAPVMKDALARIEQALPGAM